MSDTDQLEDDIAAHYQLVKRERPDLSPDDIVSMIAGRMGEDAELALAVADDAAGVEGSAIQHFVYAMEYDEDDLDDDNHLDEDG